MIPGDVAKLVIAILVAVTTLAAFQSIKTTSLDPQKDQLIGQIKQFGGEREITLDEDPFTARKKMRQAIVWNMMASVDCRVLGDLHILSGTQRWLTNLEKKSGYDASDDIDEFEDEFSGSGGDISVINSSSTLPRYSRGYGGRFQDFNEIAQSDMKTSCTGAASLEQSIKEQVETAVEENSYAKKLVSYGGAATGGLAVLAVASGPVGWAGAGVVAAVSYAATPHLLKTASSTNFWDYPGMDMEGKYSRVTFESEENFSMASGSHWSTGNMLLNYKTDVGGGKTPQFFQGERGSWLLPPRIRKIGNKKATFVSPDDGGPAFEDFEPFQSGPFNVGDDKIYGHRIRRDEGAYNLGDVPLNSWKQKFYAYQVRMVNVPILADFPRELEENPNSNIKQKKFLLGYYNDPEVIGGIPNYTRIPQDPVRLRVFLNTSEYRICDGAEGYIQSNAGKMGYEDEAEGENEDYVFPKVEITEGAEDCINTKDGEIDEEETGLHCTIDKSIRGEKPYGSSAYPHLDPECAFKRKQLHFANKYVDKSNFYKLKNQEAIEYFTPVPVSDKCSKGVTRDITDSGTNTGERTLDPENMAVIVYEIPDDIYLDSVEIEYEKQSNQGGGFQLYGLDTSFEALLYDWKEKVGHPGFKVGSGGWKHFDYEGDGSYTLKMSGDESDYEVTLTDPSGVVAQGSGNGNFEKLERLQMMVETGSCGGDDCDQKVELKKVEINGRPKACKK